MATLPHALCSLLALLIISPALAQGGHEQSLHAYVLAAHKRAFDAYSLLVYGDLNLARSAVHGAVAVTRTASVEEFDFARDVKCNASVPSVTVIGTFVARAGSISGGHLLAGRGSRISHSVRRGCSPLLGRYDSYAPGAEQYSELSDSLIRDSGENTVLPQSGEVVIENNTMLFKPSASSYSCYGVFNVNADDLRLVRDWTYSGDQDKNLIINVIGKRAVMRDFKMVGFNAKRTLINFSSTYGKFQFYNSRIHASILAPTTYFTMMDCIVNGSMVTASLRGQIVVLKQSYIPC